MTANPGLASSGPNYVRIGTGNGQRPDGRNRLRIKYRFPVNPAVNRFENPTRGRTGVVDVRLSRYADNRRDPITDRADVTPAQWVKVLWLRLRADRNSHSRHENGK